MYCLMELVSTFSSKLRFGHKLVALICLSLCIYALISSETLSLLTGINRNYNANNNNVRHIVDRKRGIRTNDRNGNLLFYHLPNLTDYFVDSYYKPLTDDKLCSIDGTNWNQSYLMNRCVCINDFDGNDCGIPSIVFNSELNQLNNIVIRRLSRPKRIVLSVILFPTRNSLSIIPYIDNTLKLLSDLIDLFIIAEIKLVRTNNNDNSSLNVSKSLNSSYINPNLTQNYDLVNISANSFKTGANRDYSYDLKDVISNGQLKQYSNLILYESIRVSYKQLVRIPANRLQSYALSKVWTTSVRRVTDFRPDDILIYMSSNSFPLKEIVMFLKHYSGFPEPIKFISYLPQHYINNKLFKLSHFYDPTRINNNNLLNFAISFEYISLLCRYDLNLFKRNQCINDEIHVKKFIDTYWPIKFWRIGNYDFKASATYACSECLAPY